MPQSVQKITITEDAAGQRLDNFLMRVLKGVPKSRIYRLMRKGEVRVNRGRVKPDYRLKTQDQVRIPPVRKPSADRARPPDSFLEALQEAILYQDNAIILLNKPSGVAVHGGSGIPYGVIEALPYLSDAYKTVHLAHRLDRETSGCLLLARHRQALNELHHQMRDRQVTKHYRALVQGRWQEEEVVTAALSKQTLAGGERMIRVDSQGQSAKTIFRPLRFFKDVTLMEAELVTGRMHQIRVHAQSQGHPIAGDDKYGERIFNKAMKLKGLSRLFLHADRVGFFHPGTGVWFEQSAPLDQVLNNVLKVID